ncbi:hypothetical protein AJ80_03252 [Polytolypa hystricis UAMH7299]|uniref:F-box domain-containing protein n=1 Tax=Polytolypa hystricis (strain UAMH7299) TaxID=1447883 RepID=A0A2B7YK76_POLH7|nr:hypothetical protein AJ80_03252 [Polytolypa hystricis UAMH7299]
MTFKALPTLLRAPHGSRRRKQRAECAPAARGSLLGMPAELLYAIYENLSFNAALALTFTCARFYYSEATTNIHKSVKSSSAARYILMCYLERDGMLKGYFCRGCWKSHSTSSSFSGEEFKKGAGRRRCLRTKQCFQSLVGEREMSFNEVVEYLRFPKKKKYVWTSRVYLFHQRGIRYSLPLFNCRYVKSAATFRALCSGFNIPLCPHLRLNSKRVTEQFSDLSKSEPRVRCDSCKTDLCLSKQRSGTQDLEYTLVVRRSLGRLFSPRDPAWLAHTYSSRDPRLNTYCHEARHWLQDATEALKRGRPLPEPLQDIVPEDGSLFTPVVVPTFRASRVVDVLDTVQAGLLKRPKRKM